MIELVLSMTFVSVLLLAIALTVIQISNIYNKGLTVKEVSQVGRSIASEIAQGVSSSSPFSIESGPGGRFISDTWGGRLCIGQYSYIWNYGSTLNESNPLDINKYATNPDSLPSIRFAKVVDSNSAYCEDPSSDIDSSNVSELLYASDHDIVIHSFSIISEPTAIDPRTKERLYNFTFFVGTNDGSALTNDRRDCKEPGEVGADPIYCSVQDFNVTVRAGNLVE